jgi:hypothetical protein
MEQRPQMERGAASIMSPAASAPAVCLAQAGKWASVQLIHHIHSTGGLPGGAIRSAGRIG